MRFEYGALPWELLGRRPVMITLTYPGDWELWVADARELHRHRENLKERWRRRFGTPIGVWVTEFQRRGAPHLHLYLGLPEEVSEKEYQGLQKRTITRKNLERRVGSYEARSQLRAPSGEFAMWLRKAWWEVVGSELPAHHGRGVDIATAFFSDQAEAQANRVRVAEYFWRESGKWAQKQPPEGFGGLKFYGRWGQKQGFAPVVSVTEMDERVGLELRRVLRRMMLGKMREAALRSGRKMPRNAGRSRGRDGLTVFGVDGHVVGPTLLAWAEQVALDKASRATATEEHASGRFRHAMLRSLSEIQIDVDSSPDPDEWLDPDPPAWEDEEEAAIDALIDADEARLEAGEALHEAWLAERERERRRVEMRRAGGGRGPRPNGTGSGGRRRP